LEREVRQTLPPVRKKTLVLVLEDDRLEAWEQTREACERLAGKTLSDIEVFDLMCAETLCTYALTPAFGDKDGSDECDEGDEKAGGVARSIAERDGWICSRPGCSNRSALTGNHIIPRSRSGPDEDWNLHLVCQSCHLAITEGRLKVSGRAPDNLTWEGPFGAIEKPLPLAPKKRDSDSGSEALLVRESPPIYGGSSEGYDRKQLNGCFSDHVIEKVGPVKRLGLRLARNRPFDLPASRRKPREISIEAPVNVSC
jgi:5-methylcytosine-specific restriction endonuclease McrA